MVGRDYLREGWDLLRGKGISEGRDILKKDQLRNKLIIEKRDQWREVIDEGSKVISCEQRPMKEMANNLKH